MEVASRIKARSSPPVRTEPPQPRDSEDSPPIEEVQREEFSKESLQDLAKKFQDTLRSIHGTSVQFGVHLAEGDGPNDIRFRITNEDTGEVVREFPPGKVRTLTNNFNLTSKGKGLLFDSSA